MDEKISVAPMMECTDGHWRALVRGITKKTVLYTEMVVDTTILHQQSNLDFFIGREQEEHPSVIQLGGNDPELLGKAAEIVNVYGDYQELNLNCGCPSARVSQKCFGARLMLEPDHVRQIVSTMARRVSVPVTVKCRLGVDDHDSYEELTHFIDTVRSGGVNKFIIHARKCLLNGLTTKQNRDIPPLRYEVVHRLVQDFPDLTFVLNGGVRSLVEAEEQLCVCPPMSQASDITSASLPAALAPSTSCSLHGVMIGRAAFSNPLMLSTIDSQFYGVSDPCLTRRGILERYINYCERIQSEEFGPVKIGCRTGLPQMITTSVLLKPIQQMMNGVGHCARYRNKLNDMYVEAAKQTPNPDPRPIIEGAMACMKDDELDAPIGRQVISDALTDGEVVCAKVASY